VRHRGTGNRFADRARGSEPVVAPEVVGRRRDFGDDRRSRIRLRRASSTLTAATTTPTAVSPPNATSSRPPPSTSDGGAAASSPDGGAGSAEVVRGGGAKGLRSTGGTSAVSAATGLTWPNPVTLSRPGASRSVAVAMSRFTTLPASRSG
jgi:hypothetical protein